MYENLPAGRHDRASIERAGVQPTKQREAKRGHQRRWLCAIKARKMMPRRDDEGAPRALNQERTEENHPVQPGKSHAGEAHRNVPVCFSNGHDIGQSQIQNGEFFFGVASNRVSRLLCRGRRALADVRARQGDTLCQQCYRGHMVMPVANRGAFLPGGTAARLLAAGGLRPSVVVTTGAGRFLGGCRAGTGKPRKTAPRRQRDHPADEQHMEKFPQRLHFITTSKMPVRPNRSNTCQKAPQTERPVTQALAVLSAFQPVRFTPPRHLEHRVDTGKSPQTPWSFRIPSTIAPTFQRVPTQLYARSAAVRMAVRKS